MKIRCLIVDDEPLAVKVIENYLNRLKDFEIVASCENAMDAFDLLQEKEIDLLFLDIQMPMLTGLDFVKSLKNPPLIIFTTAYKEYAIEGFEADAIDYLIKPIPFPRFMQAVNKATKFYKSQHQPTFTMPPTSATPLPKNPLENSFIFLKVDKKMVKVYLKDILYIESLKDYIRVITNLEELIVHQTLTSITESLPAKYFLRIHRSYTISIDKVHAIEGNCVEIGKNLIPIGRNYVQEVKEKIYSGGLKS